MSLHLEQVFVFVFLYDNFDFTSLSGVERVQLWPLGQWGSFVRSALGPGGSPGWPLGERGRVESGGEPSPVHHRVSVEGHEENLAATSRTHRCEEYLERENIPSFKFSLSQ